MIDKEMNKLITAELEKQVLNDLCLVMDKPEGRRLFSWLIMQCGQNNTSFTRDSQTQTYFNEGMRNVALILEAHMRLIGLSGVDAMYKAEREYIELLEGIKRKIKEQQGGKKNNA